MKSPLRPNDTNTSESAEAIIAAIFAGMLAITPAINRIAGREQISLVQIMLLQRLRTWENEPSSVPDSGITMSEISRWVGHSTAAATGLIDRLEKLGYVERLRALEDRRKVLVGLTQKGRDLLTEIRDDLLVKIAQAASESGAEETRPAQRDLAGLLRSGKIVPFAAA